MSELDARSRVSGLKWPFLKEKRDGSGGGGGGVSGAATRSKWMTTESEVS